MIHLHRFEEVGREPLFGKWRFVEECRCGRTRSYEVTKTYAEATPEERAAESSLSRATRMLGV